MDIDELRQNAETIFEEYDAKFAGKPRANRDLDVLDELIDRLERLLAEARSQLNGGRNEALMGLIERASENLEIYQEEREAIREVKQGGDAPVEASELATWANIEFHRYRRHFAGENRTTRDTELLSEMITRLKLLREEMTQLADEHEVPGLEQDIETVETNLEQYRNERERIVTARADGEPDERASYLAVAANEQFSIYRDLFAGKNRITRRPALLSRVIRTLENLHSKMEELEEEEGTSSENRDNVELVEDNLEMYRDELDAIEQAREQVDVEELAGHLGRAANETFEEYREQFAGEDRPTRDLDRLGRLCDELYHLGRQMEDIGARDGIEMNAENLSIVLENLSLYQREYDAIEEAGG
jgi:transaldolase